MCSGLSHGDVGSEAERGWLEEKARLSLLFDASCRISKPGNVFLLSKSTDEDECDVSDRWV